MSGKTFSVAESHPPRDGLTVSTSARLSGSVSVTYFSLGRGTDISPETYTNPLIYFGAFGSGEFVVGKVSVSDTNSLGVRFGAGDLLYVKQNTLCGVRSREGLVYTEIMPEEDIRMNEALKSGEVLKLADLLPYEEESIVNMDIASNDAMKFVIMAFDEGTGLSPHRAPGDALVFALEGKAVIGYEGVYHPIKAGETFRFAKNGLHSVKADGRFKMALLLVLK